MLRLYKKKTSGSWLDLPQEAGWLGHDRLYALAFLLLRIGLGGLFIYAGAIKLENPQAFAQVLAKFGLLPDRFLPSAAVGLPLLELLVGVGVILEVRGSFTAVSLLLVLFLLVLGYAIYMGWEIDCGCFTVDEINAKNSLKYAFLRDSLMLWLICFLAWWRRLLRLRKSIK